MNAQVTLAALFAAIFAYVRDQLKGKVNVDEIGRIARTVLDEMRIADGPVTWEDAEPLEVGHARWLAHAYRPVRIVGQVTDLHDPAVAVVPTGDGKSEPIETTAATIVGLDGERLMMLDIVGRPLIERIQEQHRSGRLSEFLGVVVVLPVTIDPKRPDRMLGASRHFFFHLVDVRPSASAFDLLGATNEEREHARSLLARIRAGGSTPLAYLHERLVAGLGVAALDAAEHLNQAFTFAVLQGASVGTVGQAPARLHILVVGPPGVGKKLIGLAAKALNPISREASAAKVSAAGLVGASYRTETGWRSTPGLLPLSSEGVLLVQDAHGWAPTKMAQIGPILQELIEDGQVRDAVAGGKTRSASAALVIDANRHAHLGPRPGSVASEAAILTLLPLLSRFDVVMEIPLDAERSWTVAAAVYRELTQNVGQLGEQPWVREVRLLVAALREEHPVIDVSSVLPLLERAHEEIRSANADFIKWSPAEASALPVRMAVSLMRLVIASARASGRDQATAEDVERARAFVDLKIRFLREAAGHRTAVRRPTPAEYVAGFAGQEVNPSDLARRYNDETGATYDQKTFRRHVQRAGGVHVGRGTYRLPELPPGADRDVRTHGGEAESAD